MPDRQVRLQETSTRFVVYVCPECGEQITDIGWDAERGAIHGHYHDPPADWPHAEDPWFDAEPVEVVPRSDAEALAEALEEAFSRAERSVSGITVGSLEDALAEYRERHPKETSEHG